MKFNKVVIAIPSTASWEAEFGMSLVFLVNHIGVNNTMNKKPTSFIVQNKRGSILAAMRQSLVDNAIKNNATHILFIDSDQIFPADLLNRLMAHDKPVIACNIATKMIPSKPTARQKDPTNIYGQLVSSDETVTGLEKVWRIGTGIMLINLNVFKREGMKERPWFSQYWNGALDSYIGEDWAFCERLEAAGVSIYIDHDVSKEVGHIGRLTYNMDMVQDMKVKEAC